MESNEGRWPLILLSFDDPQVLTDGAKVGEWSLFTELRRILQRLDSRGISIFSLFLSTAGNFRFLSPDIKTDPSSRVWNNNLRPFHPITDISFDCLARPASEDSVTLFQVVQIDWIAHLGRPLYVSFIHCLGWLCSCRIDLALTLTPCRRRTERTTYFVLLS
jgi:hypothetical protein